MIDTERFEAARQAVVDHNVAAGGIGTLGEKPLHAVVKHFLEPDVSRHEQRVGPFIVDILTDERIFEIQTRQFRSLRPKLEGLLPEHRLTIVYPMQARKWLLWLDPETGELTAPRLSPRRGQLCDIFRELAQIKPFLAHPNLSVMILLVDLEEYRLLNGWSHDRKKGSRRHDRLPLQLQKSVSIEGPDDYGQLMPADLPACFTSVEFAKAARVSPHLARYALNILLEFGHVAVCGKQGRLRLYHRSP